MQTHTDMHEPIHIQTVIHIKNVNTNTHAYIFLPTCQHVPKLARLNDMLIQMQIEPFILIIISSQTIVQLCNFKEIKTSFCLLEALKTTSSNRCRHIHTTHTHVCTHTHTQMACHLDMYLIRRRCVYQMKPVEMVAFE